jgi:hypothetical protein
MKLELQNPSTQDTVDYFVAMAKGQTAPTNSRNGLGKQPTTYHVITPVARVIAHAKKETEDPGEVIRSPAKKAKYSMPGLD